ncbi:hypothetical protein ANCCAN_19185 [Ancylostoma caninum]|uniref:Uncharacterized protein n=1 Tax=Ancylostoma caninum TaxID=29170 RepID=A0A368FW09_ANCCA|nr:hypothetical protein ANCCAN_19185 [Ancylostoma caninum]
MSSTHVGNLANPNATNWNRARSCVRLYAKLVACVLTATAGTTRVNVRELIRARKEKARRKQRTD